MIFYSPYIGAEMLRSYKWIGLGWVGIGLDGSLCGAILWASLCDANKCFHQTQKYVLVGLLDSLTRSGHAFGGREDGALGGAVERKGNWRHQWRSWLRGTIWKNLLPCALHCPPPTNHFLTRLLCPMQFGNCRKPDILKPKQTSLSLT